MKKIFVLSAVAVLSFLSCSKESDHTEGELTSMTFTLGSPQKTTLSGTDVYWETTDKLSVFDKLNANRVFTTTESGSTAVFSGSVVISSSYSILYPYDASASIDNGVISTVLPSVQQAVAGSFASGSNLACCVTQGQSAVMKNACAIIGFTINPSVISVKSMKFESVGGQKVSGPVNIEIKNGSPALTASENALSSVSLIPASPVSSGTFYFTVCPGTLSEGFQLSFMTTDNKVLIVNGTNPLELVRNEIVDLGSFDLTKLISIEEEPDDPIEDPVSVYASSGIDFKKLRQLGHPRLFLTASDFAALKQRLITNPDANDMACRLHQIIMDNATKYAGSADIAKHEIIGKRMLTECREALERMFSCSYAYRMTGEEKYLTKARTELAAVSAFPDWNDKQHFLDPSEMALAVAIAYDWLYYDLTLAERTAAHTAMKNFDLTPFKKYSTSSTNNWNQVCNGGAIAAAIAVYEKDKTLAAYDIDKAIKSNLACAKYTYDPNGNGHEGNGYWGYAMSFQMVIIQALETAFGSSCGIADVEGLKKTGLWKLFMIGPTGGFNFSDSGSVSLGAVPQFIWLAARFNQPELLVRDLPLLYNTSYSSDRCLILSICALAKYPFEPGSASFPKNKIWWANDLSPLVLTRIGWNYDASDRFFGLKGGGAYNNHSHMDGGSFVYDAFGIRWAWDTSMGSYTEYEKYMSGLFSRNQKANRWDILCQNNYFHNVISFTWADGSVDKWHVTDQVVGQNGKVLSTIEDEADGCGGKVDISCYYTDAASSVTREMRLIGDELVIIDEITSKSSHAAPFEWRMVTKADVSVEDGYIRLTQNGVTVYLYTKGIGSVSVEPVYGYEAEIVRPSTWISRIWDANQSYAGFHVVKFSSEVASGSKTGTYTTFISPLKPSENSMYISGEIPGLENRHDAQW